MGNFIEATLVFYKLNRHNTDGGDDEPYTQIVFVNEIDELPDFCYS